MTLLIILHIQFQLDESQTKLDSVRSSNPDPTTHQPFKDVRNLYNNKLLEILATRSILLEAKDTSTNKSINILPEALQSYINARRKYIQQKQNLKNLVKNKVRDFYQEQENVFETNSFTLSWKIEILT